MAKHKRVLRDGQTARGPARWARAAGNAFERPNSPQAKLYLDRVSRAHALRIEYAASVGPHAHGEHAWTWDRETGGRYYGERLRVRYYTCSLYCTAMQVQLDARDLDTYEKLELYLMENETAPRPESPARTSRCQVCGTSIAP